MPELFNIQPIGRFTGDAQSVKRPRVRAPVTSLLAVPAGVKPLDPGIPSCYLRYKATAAAQAACCFR